MSEGTFFPLCISEFADRQQKAKRASGALDPASLADNEHETKRSVSDLRETRAQWATRVGMLLAISSLFYRQSRNVGRPAAEFS